MNDVQAQYLLKKKKKETPFH